MFENTNKRTFYLIKKSYLKYFVINKGYNKINNNGIKWLIKIKLPKLT